ncbi:MAG: 16S rRNA (uracil1498-N3)-methyltransferase [Gammaproteobacteria bacterium]
MRLSRIFIEQPLIVGSKVQLDIATSHYVRNVLRLKSGTNIVLFNGLDCCDYESTLCFDGKKTFASIASKLKGNTESSLDSEIIQGLSRNDHLDWMIQKTTELGVKRISIFNSNHSQIPVKPNQLEKKQLHWRAIAINACEQSGRHVPPKIDFFNSLQSLLDAPYQRENKFLLDFQGPRLVTLLQSRPKTPQISIMLGAEGGLSVTEIGLANGAGFISSKIGSRVLRTETAAVTALAIAQSYCGDI